MIHYPKRILIVEQNRAEHLRDPWLPQRARAPLSPASGALSNRAEPLVSDVRQSQSLLRCVRQENLDHGIRRLPK